MRHILFTPIILIFLLSCSGPNGFDKQKETAAILKMHHLQRDYHFNKDSVAFADQLSDEFISVNRGVISRPEKKETLSRYDSYFSSVEFDLWDDVTPPIIKFSDDGTLAYTIVNKIVKVSYPGESGEPVIDATHFAWTTIYRKYDDEWKIDCVTSSERPVDSSIRDYLIIEKDIIPEGTAYDSKTNTIYIGSIYKQKIIAIHPDGQMEDMITKTIFDDLSPIGMEVDSSRNTLWVNVALAPIVNQTGKDDWKTTIMSFDLMSNQLIKKYELIEGDRVFLNDLTIDQNGDVFATESANGKLYKLDVSSGKLAIFKDLSEFGFPNGITYHGPTNDLFVATNEGIVKVDIETKELTILESEDQTNAKVIDGLALYDDYFIGHQSSKVSKFYFDESMSRIVRSEVFDSGEEFDSSTTGEVGNGSYHYIVNSQIRSGIDREKNKIKPLDSLENVIIRSKRL